MGRAVGAESSRGRPPIVPIGGGTVKPPGIAVDVDSPAVCHRRVGFVHNDGTQRDGCQGTDRRDQPSLKLNVWFRNRQKRLPGEIHCV
jgi:hypothetical protein